MTQPKYVKMTGKLGKYINFRATRNGGSFVTFSIRQGKDWTRCIAFGMEADALRMAREGDSVLINGVEKEDKWIGKDGSPKSQTQIRVSSITVESKEVVDGELVQEPSKVFGSIEVQATDMTEDDLPF